MVEVDLPAEDAGFIKLGQKTEIKVTAYPFEQYGSIRGKVLWISPTADSNSDLTSPPEGEKSPTCYTAVAIVSAGS
ncbi:MAG: HlyD family efflux transporter periplasmic adaptor subunit [Steroidobacteraceae bacterium]